MKSNFYTLTRSGSYAVFLFFSVLFFQKNASAQQFLTKIDGWNAYVHLPDDYNDGSNRTYPVIIFVPGLGEVGTDPAKLLVYGPSKFVAQGHNMQFTVNGVVHKPIVISIQPATSWPNPASVNRKIDSITLRWRCNTNRINVTGLSMGGWVWQNYIDGYSDVYTNRLASMVAMSAVPPDNTIPNMKPYAVNGGKWWGFEGTQDYRLMDIIRDTLNSGKPGAARYTQYVGGHCCWNTWYDPSWNEAGESIYTWMMKQERPGSSSLPVDLVEFSAKKSGTNVVLQWKTTQEVNCNHYVVEKGKNTPAFGVASTVAAKGNSTVLTSYTATDSDPVNGTNYYRLKIVDNDGSFSYSKIVAVDIKGIKKQDFEIAAFANEKYTKLMVTSTKVATANLKITDAAGRLIQQVPVQLVPGQNEILQPSIKTRGVYHVSLLTRQDVHAVSFIRQ
ncbi:MAG: hypothetical protein WAT19_13240 [Ferruginibacter sp.]